MGPSRSSKPAAACPVCGRVTVLLKDGRVGRHGAAPTAKRSWPPQLCPGWGQMPGKTDEDTAHGQV
jgi:hypothetical protein